MVFFHFDADRTRADAKEAQIAPETTTHRPACRQTRQELGFIGCCHPDSFRVAPWVQRGAAVLPLREPQNQEAHRVHVEEGQRANSAMHRRPGGPHHIVQLVKPEMRPSRLAVCRA